MKALGAPAPAFLPSIARRLCWLLSCHTPWRGARCGAAVRHRRGVRLAYSAARRALPLSQHARPLIAYGLLTALAFALWPLGRAHDISVSMLFRDQIAAERRWPRRRYVIATVSIIAALAAMAVLFTYDRRLAAIFLASAALIFVALRLVAMLVMAVARRLPRPRSTPLRLAIANIHRPGALTPSVVLSLGLGLCLLVTLIEIDGNLHRQFTAGLPEKAPSFFFLDIPSADAERFDGVVRAQAPRSTLERVPMLRGRIVAANGIKAEDLKPGEGSAWVLRGDRGITYATAIPEGSRVVAGDWWGADYAGAPLVSLESKTAADLNLKIGDTITVNVLGRNITARIANLRAVDWQNSASISCWCSRRARSPGRRTAISPR